MEIRWTDRMKTEEVSLKSQGGKEYSTYSTKKEGKMDWSHLA